MSKRFGTRKPAAAKKTAMQSHDQALHGTARSAIAAAQKASSGADKVRYKRALEALNAPDEESVHARALRRV